ncbi:MAG: PRC-barrel domain-containing protein [Beijerinckiaceae bacterium]|nr:PRC-barrel domain-containing protein [Beijerinckiaceae bacterium]
MKKKHLAYLLATTLLAAPAIAQTGASPGTAPAAPPAADTQRGATPGTNTGATGAQGGAMSGTASNPSNLGTAATSADVNRALATPGVGQMMSSDIRGTNVYGANNESVGDVSDILLSREGEIVALVVGVGGFLGIGQKDVAIPFKAFDFVTEGQATTRTSTSTSPGATGTAPGMTSGAGTTAAPGTATAPATGAGAGMGGVSGTTSNMTDTNQTGATGSAVTGSTPGATGGTGAQQTAGLLKPERIVLRGMTKADLEAAPRFERTAASTSAPAR